MTWTTTEAALPLPIDPKDKLMDLAVKSSDIIEALDQEMLRVAGPRRGPQWELKIDGVSAGTSLPTNWPRGINLATLTPPC